MLPRQGSLWTSLPLEAGGGREPRGPGRTLYPGSQSSLIMAIRKDCPVPLPSVGERGPCLLWQRDGTRGHREVCPVPSCS